MADHANEIMRILGRLEESTERLRTDFESEKDSARDSRGRTHAKLEKIEEDISIVGQAAAQARAESEVLRKLVTEDVKPATDDFKRMRTIGFAGITLIGFAFTALGVTISTWWESAGAAVRAWLRIP